ncbi:fructose-bisphosphatase class II [Amycolatopsis sp. La24]|uniref:fructose-bisphosphatase class II n=1 Tax=Amycolatopsis sp. La24 TaxID=3028304 RepID=UPI0023AEF138|nr:fructose-bisphosphatase class II [Amycolatopsis sp. La24]
MKSKEWGLAAAETARRPDDALALELVRGTESAALAAGRWAGHRDDSAGLAAMDAMHTSLRSVAMDGVVVLGAGSQDDAPALFHGAEVGTGQGPVCDIAISIGDGVLSEAKDVPRALTAVAVSARGAMADLASQHSMEKLAVGPGLADVVDITRPVAENLRRIAGAKGVRVSDVVVATLNRRRHVELAREIQDAGARVHLVEGGEVAGAVAAARPEHPIDVFLCTGNAVEGVIAAAALSCLGGSMQARVAPEGPAERPGTVLRTEDLVGKESVVFCASGVTSSELLRGVRNDGAGRTTVRSLVLCSDPDTVRAIRSEHRYVRERGRA